MERQKQFALNKNLAHISDIAAKGGWVFEYDSDLDELYWSKPNISRDAKLVRLTDDFAFYLKPNGAIEGVFIEYAKFNFFAHERSMEKLLKKLERSDRIKTNQLDTKLVAQFTEKIRTEALEAADFSGVVGIFHKKPA